MYICKNDYIFDGAEFFLLFLGNFCCQQQIVDPSDHTMTSCAYKNGTNIVFKRSQMDIFNDVET